MTPYTSATQLLIGIKIFNILFFLTIIPFFFYPEACASNATVNQKNGPKKIIIAPVKNETREKQFNNLLVMNGIKNLVAQALFDTGMFIPLEKDPKAIKNIEEFIGRNIPGTNDSNETVDYMTIRPTIKKLKKVGPDLCLEAFLVRPPRFKSKSILRSRMSTDLSQ